MFRNLSIAGVLALAGGLAAQPATWLDRPVTAWPEGATVPVAGALDASAGAPCVTAGPATPESGLVGQAGWRPFSLAGRELARGAIRVVGGLRRTLAGCAPADFQAFVFVDGVYAGRLSPDGMTTGLDGVIGTIRLLPDEVITAEFLRYRPGDSECCPSGRVRVTYEVRRHGGRARVAPVSLRVLRE